MAVQHHPYGAETPESKLCEFQERGNRASHNEKDKNNDDKRWVRVSLHPVEMCSQALDSLGDHLSFWVAGLFLLA